VKWKLQFCAIFHKINFKATSVIIVLAIDVAIIIYIWLNTCCSLVLSIGFYFNYFFISSTALASSNFIYTLCLSIVRSPEWGIYPNSFKNSNSLWSLSNLVCKIFKSCCSSVCVLTDSINFSGQGTFEFWIIGTSVYFSDICFFSCFSFSLNSYNLSFNCFIMILFYCASVPSLSLFIVYKTYNFRYKAFWLWGSIFIA